MLAWEDGQLISDLRILLTDGTRIVYELFGHLWGDSDGSERADLLLLSWSWALWLLLLGHLHASEEVEERREGMILMTLAKGTKTASSWIWRHVFNVIEEVKWVVGWMLDSLRTLRMLHLRKHVQGHATHVAEEASASVWEALSLLPLLLPALVGSLGFSSLTFKVGSLPHPLFHGLFGLLLKLSSLKLSLLLSLSLTLYSVEVTWMLRLIRLDQNLLGRISAIRTEDLGIVLNSKVLQLLLAGEAPIRLLLERVR